MNTQERIEEMTAEIRRLKGEQSRCSHEWGDAHRDYMEEEVPVVENQPFPGHYFNPVTVGKRTEKVPVWRRTCRKCGKHQTTTNTETVTTAVRPVF